MVDLIISENLYDKYYDVLVMNSNFKKHVLNFDQNEILRCFIDSFDNFSIISNVNPIKTNIIQNTNTRITYIKNEIEEIMRDYENIINHLKTKNIMPIWTLHDFIKKIDKLKSFTTSNKFNKSNQFEIINNIVGINNDLSIIVKHYDDEKINIFIKDIKDQLKNIEHDYKKIDITETIFNPSTKNVKFEESITSQVTFIRPLYSKSPGILNTIMKSPSPLIQENEIIEEESKDELPIEFTNSSTIYHPIPELLNVINDSITNLDSITTNLNSASTTNSDSIIINDSTSTATSITTNLDSTSTTNSDSIIINDSTSTATSITTNLDSRTSNLDSTSTSRATSITTNLDSRTTNLDSTSTSTATSITSNLDSTSTSRATINDSASASTATTITTNLNSTSVSTATINDSTSTTDSTSINLIDIGLMPKPINTNLSIDNLNLVNIPSNVTETLNVIIPVKEYDQLSKDSEEYNKLIPFKTFSSQKLGVIGESFICNVLNDLHYDYLITTKTPHVGDIRLTFEDFVIMFEIKNKKVITQEDITKFKSDINNLKSIVNKPVCGCFISLVANNILNSSDLQFNIYETYIPHDNLHISTIQIYIESLKLIFSNQNFGNNIINIINRLNNEMINYSNELEICQKHANYAIELNKDMINLKSSLENKLNTLKSILNGINPEVDKEIKVKKLLINYIINNRKWTLKECKNIINTYGVMKIFKNKNDVLNYVGLN